MTRTFRTALALPVLAAAFAVSGCASTPPAGQATAPAADAQDSKFYRTGSKLPALTNYYGPETVKSINAAKDRDQVDRMVNPVRPLRGE